MAIITQFLAALLLLFTTTAYALESDYSAPWCVLQGGEHEKRLADGTRVDCLTTQYAIEVDFATKWYEAVGQALHYARMTGKQPGIMLIVGAGEDVYFDRLSVVAQTNCPRIRVWRVPR